MTRLVPSLLLGIALAQPALAADLSSYAFVNKDGSIEVNSKTVHLFGILIPPTDETCRTFERPIQCGPQAVLALQFDIGSHFVDCDIKQRNPDGSVDAACHIDHQDLSQLLLEQGWAVALPDAPYEYQVLEEMARVKGIGIWGIPVQRRMYPHRRHHR